MEIIQYQTGECTRVISARRREGIHYPDLIIALRERYGFEGYPEKLRDMTMADGMKFEMGRFIPSHKGATKSHKNAAAIATFVINTAGVLASGECETSTVDDFLDDVLGFFETRFGYEFAHTIKTRYLSRILFSSNIDLLPPIPFSQSILSQLSQDNSLSRLGWGEYELSGLQFRERSGERGPIAPYHFSLLRASTETGEAPRYLSDAPITTESHIKLLERFEADLAG